MCWSMLVGGEKRGTVAAQETFNCMTLVCIAVGDGWLLSLEESAPEEHGHRTHEECVCEFSTREAIFAVPLAVRDLPLGG